MAATYKQILEAIETIVKATDTKALTITSHLLGIEEGGSLDAYRSEADENKIHAWIMFRSKNIPRYPDNGAKPSYYAPHAAKPFRLDNSMSFLLKLYLSTETGSATDNSTLDAHALYDALRVAIAKKPKLGLAEDAIHSHGQLQLIQDRGVLPANDDGVHLLYCQLDVLVYETITP